MKELLLLLLMAAVGFLVYDDHSKRTSLEQAIRRGFFTGDVATASASG